MKGCTALTRTTGSSAAMRGGSARAESRDVLPSNAPFAGGLEAACSDERGQVREGDEVAVPPRLGNGQHSRRPQNAANLIDARRSIGQLAENGGDEDRVEGGVAQRETGAVGLDRDGLRRAVPGDA